MAKRYGFRIRSGRLLRDAERHGHTLLCEAYVSLEDGQPRKPLLDSNQSQGLQAAELLHLLVCRFCFVVLTKLHMGIAKKLIDVALARIDLKKASRMVARRSKMMRREFGLDQGR